MKPNETEDIVILPYIQIPAYVYRSELGVTAQKICGLIFSLSSQYGYCFASNNIPFIYF